jgi:spore coat protein U-like protein
MTTHDLGFGTYDPLGANKTQDLFTEADISVTCTKDAATTISLSSGGHAAGGTRQLTDGAATPHFLTYSLYSDPTRTAAWGDGTLAAVLSYAGTGASDTVKVYGKIEKSQLAAPGDFTDTVTATITF